MTDRNESVSRVSSRRGRESGRAVKFPRGFLIERSGGRLEEAIDGDAAGDEPITSS